MHIDVLSHSGLEDLVKDKPDEPKGFDLVGSGEFDLAVTGPIVLGSDSVYQIGRGVRRTPLIRQPWMVGDGSRNVSGDRLRTLATRFFGGEALILDLYEAEDYGQSTTIRISSDVIGSRLEIIDLDRPLVARKSVFFGSQPDVRFGLTTPLKGVARAGNYRAAEALRLAAYGPGPVLQRFSPIEKGKRNKIILNFEGDWSLHELGEDQTMDPIDPRHLYAWDESVTMSLVPFGTKADLLLRGTVRYYVGMKGPGRVWTSNTGYTNGYWGQVLTPSHWVHTAGSLISKTLGKITP